MSDTYKALREEAWEANLEILKRNLAIYTWGNVSAFDPDRGVFAIKPSGVPYDELKAGDMVVVDIEGKIVEGELRPSTDTETHRLLYREFLHLAFGSEVSMRGITHTHSTYATAFAQAKRPVPVFGTTHADHGAEEIPCTEFMSEEAVKNNYEFETGKLIIETFIKQNKSLLRMPMVLVAGHGPFAWGKNAAQSVYHAAVLEEVCKMAYLSLALKPDLEALPEHIIRRHWERKHGPNASYGQKSP
ncbi:MAG: L-ribulose-5-phosphate 4-epimerase AraD [Treponema sp.]|jgi:L-ribulose-5-phosphate 4-epimerase|nr:L-ribulose-5-phosphate 4-epimerase AraD [Treponema sp.]